LSGYINACLKALANLENVELFVANIRISNDAPFDEGLFSWINNRYQWVDNVDGDELILQLEHFQPDIILVSNWHNFGYRKVMKHFQGRAIRIFGMDNQWHGSTKQWLGIFSSRLYLHSICDAVFVAGERQAVFAHKLGFSQERIFRGLYSCNHEEFSKIYFKRKKLLSESRSFCFVGRFVPEKGIDILVAAYRRYREIASDPWSLKCYGNGPLQSLITKEDGIECKDFCQPLDLPNELLMASCLILPSVFEPWALVVHEAVSAGMPVITTDAVGAAVHLLQDGYNGYIIENGSVEELTQAMLNYSNLSQKERIAMGKNSYNLSLQFTPIRWANTLVSKAVSLQEKER
jgi:glycosyltransferase involved in cell wall biosynthesis